MTVTGTIDAGGAVGRIRITGYSITVAGGLLSPAVSTSAYSAGSP